ncbi:MAG TPA: hypothetical protein VGL13_08565 [Polyangiaceae bacterium]
MQASVRWTTAAALVFASSAAFAQSQVGPAPSDDAGGRPSASGRGFSLGLRIGYGWPLGLLAKGEDLDANVANMVPVWLDAGYRLSRELYLGGYASFGFASVADAACPSILSCSASDLRFGVNAHLHLGNLIGLIGVAPIDPWVGLGVGYETTSIKLEFNGTTATETDRGFELGNLQLGVDWTSFGALRVGGFFTLTLAQYSSRTIDDVTGSSDHTPDRALHLWLILGVRGQYDL